MAKNAKNLLIVGCDGCASIIQVGGERQAEILKTLLEMKSRVKGEDGPASKAISILRQCDRQIVVSSLNPVIGDYDTLVSLGCGVGVQTLADLYRDKLIIPANDTEFIGMHDTKADNSLAKELLNWIPQVKFEVGMKKAIEWFENLDN